MAIGARRVAPIQGTTAPDRSRRLLRSRWGPRSEDPDLAAIRVAPHDLRKHRLLDSRSDAERLGAPLGLAPASPQTPVSPGSVRIAVQIRADEPVRAVSVWLDGRGVP